MARSKHYEIYKTANFRFLLDNEDNIDTFTLGFFEGAQYANKLCTEIIEKLKEKVGLMTAQMKAIVEDRDKDVNAEIEE